MGGAISDTGRSQLPAGELGKISVTRLQNGRYQARGATRDDSGALQRLRASGETEEAARKALRVKATRHCTGAGSGLTPENTIAEGVERCFEQRTVGRCDRVLQDILATDTLSKARRARTALGLLCGYAVRADEVASLKHCFVPRRAVAAGRAASAYAPTCRRTLGGLI